MTGRPGTLRMFRARRHAVKGMINRAGKAAELPDRDLGAGLGRLPGLLPPGLEEAVARGAVSAEEAATLTVDSLIVSGSGGRIYSPTNEGFITLQMKPATG